MARFGLWMGICIVIFGLPLGAWFRATTAAEVWPRSAGPAPGPRVLVQSGRVLAKPAYWFVGRVMTRIDHRYACAGAWHPVYPVSFTVLCIGYAGSGAFVIHSIFQSRHFLRQSL